MVTDDNEIYCCDHFTEYTDTESCSIWTETNMLNVNFTSILKGENSYNSGIKKKRIYNYTIKSCLIKSLLEKQWVCSVKEN